MHPAQAEAPELFKKYADCGQQHVFYFWNTLSAEEKTSLKNQLKQFDPVELNRNFKNSQDTSVNLVSQVPSLSPFPEDKVDSIESNFQLPKQNIERWHNMGLDLIAAGKLAVVLLAGGQGTRLGTSLPKGCYDIGLKSGKSLMNIQAEVIRRVQILASERTGEEVSIPWYVMTSDSTHVETVKHFEERNYFGMRKSEVRFFIQSRTPAFDYSGKLLMEDKHSLSLAPNGNGSVYEALFSSGVLEEFESRGIEYVHIYCVDNVLCKVADPVFLGYAHDFKADIVAKAVRKIDPSESAGVFCLKDGKLAVSEYTEMPKELAEAKHESGDLVYYTANIANHLLSTQFLKKIIPSLSTLLPYHISKKKVKYVGQDGVQITPKSPNGIKLEKFIFDVFSMGQNFRIIMVDRNSEFVPLKNAPGSVADAPEHCLEKFIKQSTIFAKNAGAIIHNDNQNSPYSYLELSPLLSFRGEGLTWLKDKIIKCPIYISRKGETTSATGVL